MAISKRYSAAFAPALLSIFVALAVCSTSLAAECPSLDSLRGGIQKVLPPSIELGGEIHPSEVPGICEAQVRLDGQTRLLYVDSSGQFLILGQIINAQTGHNVTAEKTVALNRLSADEMKQLESLTAFTVGTGAKAFYFVTDPQCPFCKQAEQNMKPLIDSGEVAVRFLLFPLESHVGAKQQCVSTICDNKGFEGFSSEYKSENQCEEGVKKVDQTVAFLKGKGINATPAYIFPDGGRHIGVLDAATLRRALGIQPPAPPQQAPAPAK